MSAPGLKMTSLSEKTSTVQRGVECHHDSLKIGFGSAVFPQVWHSSRPGKPDGDQAPVLRHLRSQE